MEWEHSLVCAGRSLRASSIPGLRWILALQQLNCAFCASSPACERGTAALHFPPEVATRRRRLKASRRLGMAIREEKAATFRETLSDHYWNYFHLNVPTPGRPHAPQKLIILPGSWIQQLTLT